VKGIQKMTAWTNDELNKIGAAEELQIASLRGDGTLRKPVTIWVVRQGDDLYVRSVNGRTSAWFRGTQVRHEGRIRAGGVQKDVTYVDAPPTSTTRSTLPTAQSIADTQQASSIALLALRREPRQSNLCPAQ
jgi:hypothetical protein